MMQQFALVSSLSQGEPDVSPERATPGKKKKKKKVKVKVEEDEESEADPPPPSIARVPVRVEGSTDRSTGSPSYAATSQVAEVTLAAEESEPAPAEKHPLLAPAGGSINFLKGSGSSTDTPERIKRRSSAGMSDVSLYWFDVLTRYGGIDSEAAAHYSHCFGNSHLPFPSPDAKSYLTHELLSQLGVSSAGDRCRIMLACARMPELKHREEEEEEQSATERGTINLEHVQPASYDTDTTKVVVRRFAPKDDSYLWIDMVGRDLVDDEASAGGGTSVDMTKVPISSKQIVEKEKLRASAAPSSGLGLGSDSSVGEAQPQENALSNRQRNGSGQRGSKDGDIFLGQGGSPRTNSWTQQKKKSDWDEQFEGILKTLHAIDERDDFFGEPTELATLEANCTLEDLADDEGAVLLRDIVATKLPLPQLRIARSQPSKCGFVLRVCTLDVEEEDDTMRSLTNRWTVFVDAANQVIVTLHRVDSLALATLRDALTDGVIPPGVGFKEFLGKIIERFVVEYEKALDAAEEWLDACEAGMLSSSAQLSSKSDNLLTSLFHLQRRASVYDRMVILSKTLVHKEVSRHLNLDSELEPLEARFQHLQEKTVDLGSRAQNLLEIHLSLTGYHTNELMKMLTKFSMFFTPITFLAGVWGMNFQNMPELYWDSGYWIALSIMAAIALIMLLWFRLAGI